MRLEQYLTENSIFRYTNDPLWYSNKITKYELMSHTVLIPKLKKECGKYINDIKGTSPFWRGMRKATQPYKDTSLEKRTPRKSRRPLDTDRAWTLAADDYFDDKFGWRPRTQGVFATKDVGFARGYGAAFMMFPIGDYEYIWSPNVSDFWVLYDQEKHKSGPTQPGNKFKNLMDESEYTDKNIKQAPHDAEVMFRCKNYYIVNSVYWPFVYEMLNAPAPTQGEQSRIDSFITGVMP